MSASVADRIRKRLEEFTETLESGQPIQDLFACRKVAFRIQAKPFKPAAVKKTRRLVQASQPVFAIFLGISTKTLQAWEEGKSNPTKMACRFLDEIRRNPEYWR